MSRFATYNMNNWVGNKNTIPYDQVDRFVDYADVNAKTGSQGGLLARSSSNKQALLDVKRNVPGGIAGALEPSSRLDPSESANNTAVFYSIVFLAILWCASKK
jgi:hypothetical protein